MIELRTLGYAHLTARDGGGANALQAQPKRFALLCYLALPKPGTLHRRDTLVGVFWPERDQKHARMDLRQALAFIRKTLGEGVLLTRSNDEVGLNPDLVWCDAAAFQQAVEQQEWAEAVDLYRRNFLPGFFLSNDADFEHWLEAERARLTRLYCTALEEASESAAGDGRRVLTYCQRLVEQDPYSSRYAVKLMEALVAVGDPANALLHAERHEQLLHEELSVAPPVDLHALSRRIRQQSEATRFTDVVSGKGCSPPSAAAAATNGATAAGRAAGALSVALLAPELDKPHTARTASAQAYTAHQYGRYFWNKRTDVDLKRAMQY